MYWVTFGYCSVRGGNARGRGKVPRFAPGVFFVTTDAAAERGWLAVADCPDRMLAIELQYHGSRALLRDVLHRRTSRGGRPARCRDSVSHPRCREFAGGRGRGP